MIDAVIVFVPSYYPWFVAPGLSYLASYLKSRGFVVAHRDANIPAIEYLLGAESLRSAAAPAPLIERVRSALQTVRDESCYHQFWPFKAAMETIEEASEFVNRAIPDTFRIFRNTLQYISQYDARTRQGLIDAIANRRTNAFFSYFDKVEVPALQQLAPAVVGMSVNDHHQLIPAMILASMIKDRLPGVHVCIGGNLISRLKTTLEQTDPLNFRLFQYVDTFIHHEGEQPFAELLARRRAGLMEPLGAGVPNAIWCDGETVKSEPAPAPINLSDLPLPDPTAYNPWTPRPVIALNVYRGCYYSGLCSFCDINEGYDSVVHTSGAGGSVRVGFTKRLRPMHIVADDMRELSRRHNVRVFSFTDEWFRVREMLELGEHLRKVGAWFEWEAYARFEKAYLDRTTCHEVRRAGCRFLQFGLESISPATLKAMHKGNTPAEYAEILANTTSAGIWNHVFFIVGYPGEPVHHVLPLFVFLRGHGRDVLTIKPTRFQLARRAPLIHEVPDQIEPIPESEWDLYINIPFRYKQRLWCNGCRSFLDREHALPKAGRWKCAACGSWVESAAPTSRKGVDAIYTLSEVLCERHWAHSVTSTYPYVARLFLSKGEMVQFASEAPRRKTVEDGSVAEALSKLVGALRREAEMYDDVRAVYNEGNVKAPSSFRDFDAFMRFCDDWVAAAAGQSLETRVLA